MKSSTCFQYSLPPVSRYKASHVSIIIITASLVVLMTVCEKTDNISWQPISTTSKGIHAKSIFPFLYPLNHHHGLYPFMPCGLYILKYLDMRIFYMWPSSPPTPSLPLSTTPTFMGKIWCPRKTRFHLLVSCCPFLFTHVEIFFSIFGGSFCGKS